MHQRSRLCLKDKMRSASCGPPRRESKFRSTVWKFGNLKTFLMVERAERCSPPVGFAQYVMDAESYCSATHSQHPRKNTRVRKVDVRSRECPCRHPEYYRGAGATHLTNVRRFFSPKEPSRS
jgi:hypothetical protein